MIIKKTDHYGYCYGVKRAIETAEGLLDRTGSIIWCLGYIIHNPEINAKLTQKGIHFVNEPNEIPDGSTVLIRAHGVGKKCMDALEKRCDVIDCTCPNVLKIHDIVSQHDKVILFGDPNHPEIIGTSGWCKGECHIIRNIDEAEKLVDSLVGNDFVLVSQTTASSLEFKKVCDFLNRTQKVKVTFNTICGATEQRQKEVDILSSQCDAFLVIGGKNSSNTKKLYEIALSHCEAFHIENFTQLPEIFPSGYERIGLSSGTSTPAEAIEEVISIMVNENETNRVDEVSENEEFLHAMEGSIKLVRRGYRVKGIVTAINGSEIQVDLGSKHSGIIPAAEFEEDEEPVKVGDEIEAIVAKVDDVEGTALLSKKEIDSLKKLDKVRAAFENGEAITVKITEAVKGGLLARLSGLRVFIPGSLVSTRRDAKLEEYPGKEVSIKIIEFDENKHRVVGSIRAVEQEEKKKAAEELWNTIEVGQRRTGNVSSICSFGVFVNLGGADGLIHITEISWGRREKLNNMFKIGDEVNVLVKAVDKETKKISLTMKFPEEDPWKILHDTYNVGDILDVTVLRLTSYGAFVNVVPGVDGLIHISQVSDKKVNNISDELTVGQTVTVKIINIDDENKKVSLSIRAAKEPAEEEAAE